MSDHWTSSSLAEQTVLADKDIDQKTFAIRRCRLEVGNFLPRENGFAAKFVSQTYKQGKKANNLNNVALRRHL